jgi:hypothetical protein
MARYVTTIESSLPPEQAFAYMADFAHAREWDPSVASATRAGDTVGPGSTFDLVVRFGGRNLPMTYEITAYDEPRLVTLESKQSIFVSRDTITVTASGSGSSVRYDAALEFSGAAKLFDPVMQLLFNRTGDKAAAGMRASLNP